MTIKTKITSLLMGLLGLSLLVPAFAGAQTGVSGDQINATAGATVQVTVRMQQAIKKADQEIDRRIASLNQLMTRVGAMIKVTADFKQNLNSNIQAQISALSALKVKIDADTDAAVLKTDIQSIAPSYRIYALIIPQGHIAAMADREATIINMLSGVGAKLQARIQSAGTAGGDVTALNTALTDMAAKLTSAQTHAQAAITGSATLAPDEGDKTKMAANEAALKAARKELQAAQQDIVAARKDVETIVKGLRSLNVNASSTVQTQ